MIRVNYNGLIVDIKDEHLKEGIEIISAKSPTERHELMDSVEACLAEVLELLEAGKPITEKMKRNTADDVGLWFSNEVVEGRAEQYRATEH